jgi:heat shock protein HslJ
MKSPDRYKSTVLILMLIALTPVLAACSGFGGPKTVIIKVEPLGEPADLDGTEWLLDSLNGNSLAEGSTIVISFHNGRDIGGNAGCNYYGAEYTIGGSDFSITERHIDKTDFDCDVPEVVMQQEVAYFEALTNAATYRAMGNRLEIDDASGETTLVFFLKEPPPIDPALDGTEWALISLNGSDLIEGSHITLGFAEGQISGFAGCNSYGGEYTAANEGVLTIPAFMITEQDCQTPDDIMQQEQDYQETLRNAAAYQVTDNQLEIDNASGETTLVFTRQAEYSMDPSDLVGTGWRLVSWGDNNPIEGSSITLAFHDEDHVSGSAGCEGYVASYEASDDDIGFPMFAMIGLPEHCSEALIVQGSDYTTRLGQASHYRLGEGQLELLTIAGETLIFEPLPEDVNASLEGITWTLMGFIEVKTVEEMTTPILLPRILLAETEITMTFKDGAVSGSAGCNTYQATYAFGDTSLTIETLAVTEMACLNPAGVIDQEQQYLSLLGDVTIYRIHGDQLWLETDVGHALVFVQE